MDQDGNDGPSDDEGGFGSDDDEQEEEEEDRELMVACGQRQARWEKWEERCREAAEVAESQAASGLSHDEAAAKKQQIFRPREAFMMLSRELLDIIKKQSFDMFVDSLGVSVKIVAGFKS